MAFGIPTFRSKSLLATEWLLFLSVTNKNTFQSILIALSVAIYNWKYALS